MIIKNVVLNNIRSHKSTEIKFTQGINVITGNTGSGKSSILMAIEYALFGKIGEGKEEGKILLRRGESEGDIALTLLEADSEYIIIRGLKKVNGSIRNDDSKNRVIRNGNEIDLQNRASDINEYVCRILKIQSPSPIKSFEAITYIKQDELKSLIFDTTQRKQEYIDQILQLNRYLELSDAIKPVIDEISEESRFKKSILENRKIEEDMIKTESKIYQDDTFLKDNHSKLNYLDNQVENEKIRLKEAESDLRFKEDKKREYERIQNSISDVSKNIARAEKETGSIRAILKDRENIKNQIVLLSSEKEIAEKRNQLKKEIAQAEKESARARDELSEKESKYRLEVSKLESLTEELKELEERETRLLAEANGLSEELKNLAFVISTEKSEGRIEQIKSFIEDIVIERAESIKSGICMICGNKITDIAHIENEYSKKIKDYEDEMGEIRKLVDEKGLMKRKDIEKKVQLVESEEKLIKEKKSGLITKIKRIETDAFLKEMDDARKTYNGLSEVLEHLKEEYDSTETYMENINKIKERLRETEIAETKIATLEDAINKYYKDIKDLEDLKAKMGYNEDDFVEAKKNLERMRLSINSLEIEKSKLEKEIELVKARREENVLHLDALKAEAKKLASINKEVEKEERTLKLINSLRQDLKYIREYVRNKFIGQFKEVFRERFTDLRSDQDYSVDIDNEYNVTVNMNGETADARILSGGEKTAVALAYRLALSSVSATMGGEMRIETLVMDEPTSGFDREDINSFTDAIMRIKDVSQIIIVTHEENMKKIADNLIEINKNQNGSTAVYSKRYR